MEKKMLESPSFGLHIPCLGKPPFALSGPLSFQTLDATPISYQTFQRYHPYLIGSSEGPCSPQASEAHGQGKNLQPDPPSPVKHPAQESLERRRRACFLHHCRFTTTSGTSLVSHFEDVHMPRGPKSNKYFIAFLDYVLEALNIPSRDYSALLWRLKGNSLLMTGWSYQKPAWRHALSLAHYWGLELPPKHEVEDALRRGEVLNPALLVHPRILAALMTMLPKRTCMDLQNLRLPYDLYLESRDLTPQPAGMSNSKESDTSFHPTEHPSGASLQNCNPQGAFPSHRADSIPSLMSITGLSLVKPKSSSQDTSENPETPLSQSKSTTSPPAKSVPCRHGRHRGKQRTHNTDTTDPSPSVPQDEPPMSTHRNPTTSSRSLIPSKDSFPSQQRPESKRIPIPGHQEPLLPQGCPVSDCISSVPVLNPCWFKPGMVWDSFWSPGRLDPPYELNKTIGQFLELDQRETHFPITLAGGVVSTSGLPDEFLPFRESAFWVSTRELPPERVSMLDPAAAPTLIESCKRSFSAIGPVGLDLTRSDIGHQTLFLESILNSKSVKVPILLRCQDLGPGQCHLTVNRRLQDILLSVFMDPYQPIILQGFRGSAITVDDWTRYYNNIFFSINGSVASFSTSEKDGLRAIPISRLLIESTTPDFPVGTPYPMTPRFLGEVIYEVAKVRDNSFEEICSATFINGLSAFQGLLSSERQYARR